jgi:predicted transcriptional regulator
VSAAFNAKSQAREVLDRLPDDCTIEDVQYHLYVADKLRRRLEQADAGQAVPHAEAEKRLDKWRIK